MSQGWAQHVHTEVSLPGAVAQIVESRYARGGRVSQRESDIELRLRLWPTRINVDARPIHGKMTASGQMIYIAAEMETEAVANDAEDIRSVSLKIRPSWFQEVTGRDGETLLRDPRFDCDLRDAHIEQAMRRLSAEMIAPGACSGMILEACSLSISADLVRHFNDGRQICHESKDLLTQKRIKRIEDFVMSYAEGCPTLSEIAADLGIGVGYLRQVYKNSTGRTLFKFIEDVRMVRAQALLSDQSLPLKLISHRLGFCTPSAFSLAFRKGTGLTPREYRLRCA
jgi:AraC-like DNA-binding protein